MDETRSCAEVLLEKRRSLQEETPTIKDIVRAAKMTQRSFAEHLNIPLRTVEDWCRGIRKCPEYVQDLIVYKLTNESILKETED